MHAKLVCESFNLKTPISDKKKITTFRFYLPVFTHPTTVKPEERVIEFDFDYLDHYLNRATENTFVENNKTTKSHPNSK
jgi:hypothetical protein